jgi:hypothetical protein
MIAKRLVRHDVLFVTAIAEFANSLCRCQLVVNLPKPNSRVVYLLEVLADWFGSVSAI